MAIDPSPSGRAPTMEELRAFVLVADELHFARAAARLGVAAPTLSQSIRRLEGALGAVLLERTPRSVALTAAGAELAPRARDILDRLDAAHRAVVPAEPSAGTFTVGISSNGFAELTSPILVAFRRAHPGVRVTLRDVTTRPRPVLDGEVDVALVRPPVQEQWDEGVLLDEVVDEPRVALLPRAHRLAAACSIRLAELADESFVEVGPGSGRITDYWAATDGFGGCRPRLGGAADSVAGVLQSVAYLGDVITSIPSVLRFFHVPGIAAVPIEDVAPATMAVLRRRDDDRSLTRAFAGAVRDTAAAGIGLVPGGRLRAAAAEAGR